MPQNPLFQYLPITEPVFFGAETVSEDKWHQPWSEPRRGRLWPLMAASGWSGVLGAVTSEIIYEDKWHFAWSEPVVKAKIGLSASKQHVLAFQPTPIIDVSWFSNLSEPVRVKPRLRDALQKPHFEGFIQPVFLEWFANLSEPVRQKRGTAVQDQPFFSYQPTPIIDVSWFNNLSEPKREKLRLRTGLEPYSSFEPSPRVSFGWFELLSDPVRIKLGLRPSLQKELSRGEFIPSVFTAILNAQETGDFLTAVLYQFNIPLTALVDIITNDPRDRGNMGIIAQAAQSSTISAIIEPQSVPTGGSAVPMVAGARVAIIVS